MEDFIKFLQETHEIHAFGISTALFMILSYSGMDIGAGLTLSTVSFGMMLWYMKMFGHSLPDFSKK
jgi:hypothetical protein